MNEDALVADFFNDPLTSALAQQVLAMEAGQRLPSERGQAQQFGVSRTALRDRLGRLEVMGVLERRTGAGTFVKGLRPETVSESLLLGLVASKMTVSSLRSVRFALERQAAYEASRRVDHVNVAQMAVAVDRMDASDDTVELYEADLAFHKALFAASGSPALIFFADVLRGVLSRTLQHLALADDRVRMRVLHRAVYDAVAAKDTAASMQAIEDHFLWLEELVQVNVEKETAAS